MDFVNNNANEVKTHAYFKNTYIVLILSVLSWVIFGLGYNQYAKEEIGTRGFFVAGNELGVLHIVTSFYFLRRFIQTSWMKYVLFSLSSLALALLFATKVAVFGVLLLITLMPLTTLNFASFSRGRYKVRSLRLIFVLASSIIIALPKVSDILLQDIGLGRRLDYWMERVDLITLFFSGRNLLAERIFIEMIPNFDLSDWLFGPGLREVNSILGRSVELDILDYFSFYGLFGVLAYVMLLIRLVRYATKDGNIVRRKSNVILIALLVIISNTGGHVISGGLAMFSFALIFSSYEVKNSVTN